MKEFIRPVLETTKLKKSFGRRFTVGSAGSIPVSRRPAAGDWTGPEAAKTVLMQTFATLLPAGLGRGCYYLQASRRSPPTFGATSAI